MHWSILKRGLLDHLAPWKLASDLQSLEACKCPKPCLGTEGSSTASESLDTKG